MVELGILTIVLLTLGILGNVKLTGFERIFDRINRWMNKL